MVITPKSLTITQLLSAESEQYVVPAYQRRYSWHERQLGELLDDISLLEGADTHLLGSIVCLTGYHKAGINELELVDGQQRLTTICILLQCIADRLKKDGEVSAAQDIDRLLQARALGEAPVRKVLLDSLDSTDFEQHLAGKTIDHPDNDNLALAFSVFRRWVGEESLKDLGTFLYRLKNQCIVIRLDVSDAKDAFKLFETINNRGLKLSSTDIIKNFILGNAARFGPEALKLARQRWAEVLRHLDGTIIESFLRHFLCARLKRRVTRSFVIPYFKRLFMLGVAEADKLPERHWYSEDGDEAESEDDDTEGEGSETIDSNGVDADIKPTETMSFADFLDNLVRNAKAFAEVALAKTGNATFDRHLRNLRLIKSIPTYGFLMALRVGGCADGDFGKILRLTESLMTRRHICQERTTDNDRMFAKLCGVDPKNPLPEVIAAFRAFCPSDDKFEASFATADFTPNLIERARYCLEQFELRRQGQHLELLVAGADNVHVEHIIPQKIKTKKARDEFGEWPRYLGEKSEILHPNYVSRIGNLTLFAGPLNIGASNNPYERKKAAYSESAIQITKSLVTEYPDFRFTEVEKRSADMAKLAVSIWPAS